MKGINRIIVIGVFIFVAISVFDKDKTTVATNLSNQQEVKSSNSSDIKLNAYALRAKDNTWPIFESMQVELSDDVSIKNYYLVFDGSGSMEFRRCSNGKKKIEIAKAAVIDFVSKIPDDANIGLAVFDINGISERVGLGRRSKDQVIAEVINTTTGGGTPLDSAIRRAYISLTQQAKKQLGYGEYHLITITDGEAGKNQDPYGIVKKVFESSPVVMHTIGFCIDGNHSLNKAGVTLYKSANNPAELARGLDSVLAEATDFSVDSFGSNSQ